MFEIFHQDIRATLSQYSRNLRELSALFGDIPAIRCAFYCDQRIIYDRAHHHADIFLDNKFYNSYKRNIFKNFTILDEDLSYHCKNMITCCDGLYRVPYKYGFVSYPYYIHYINPSLYIYIYNDNYEIYSTYINYHKKIYTDNRVICRMITAAIEKYDSRFH